MRLFGLIEKVEQLDDGTIKVHGIASTEDKDDQGEIVTASAMRSALPDYLVYPALREMHGLQAAGTTLEAEVGDDGITRIVGHVVDPIAITKVKTKTYRAFSIGGRITKRDPKDSKTITGLVLNEISLVDRPANPSAVLEMWKASISGQPQAEPLKKNGFWDCGNPDCSSDRKHRISSAARSCMKEAAATVENEMPDTQPLNPVLQIWACGVAEHRHIAKSEALKCVDEMQKAAALTVLGEAAAAAIAEGNAEKAATAAAEAEASTDDAPDPAADPPAPDSAVADLIARGASAMQLADDALAKKGDEPYGDVSYADPGHQSDGKKRYPVDTPAHIRAAWNYINKPKNAGKYSSSQLASIKGRIVSAWKSKIDKDGPPSAGSKKAAEAFDLQKAAGVPMTIGYSPAEPLAKSLWDVSSLSQMVQSLRMMKDGLAMEAAIEGEEPTASAMIQRSIESLCTPLLAIAAEEVREIKASTEVPAEMVNLATHLPSDEAISKAITAQDMLDSEKEMFARFEAALTASREVLIMQDVGKAGSRHSAHDQAMLDMGYHASMKAAGMPGLSEAHKTHMMAAAGSFKAAGAGEGTTSPTEPREGSKAPGADYKPGQNATTDTEHNAGTSAPQVSPPAREYHGENATTDTRDNAETTAPEVDAGGSGSGSNIDHDHLTSAAGAANNAILDAFAKRNGGHQALMDIAHMCASKVSDGMTCAKVGARQSADTMGHLNAAHAHLMAAGAKCDAAADNPIPGGRPTNAGEEEHQGTEFDSDKGATTGDLQKVTTERDALAKVLGDVLPRIDALAKQVQQIADQPMPPKTILDPAAVDAAMVTLGLTRIEKGAPPGGETGPTDDERIAAFKALSIEDQSIALIKGAYRRPMMPPGAPVRNYPPRTA